MAGPIFADRVQETSTTTGTGTYTLAGALVGFQSFAAVGDGNTCFYAAFSVDGDGVPDGGWEVGIGTYTVAGTTLARTSIIASSNANAAVSWAAGTRRLVLTNTVANHPHYIVASSDESVSNDTLQNDDVFSFSMPANAIYHFDAHLLFTSGTDPTPDVKAAFTLPASATITYSGYGLNTPATLSTEFAQLTRYRGTTPTAAMGRGVISTAIADATPYTMHGIVRTGGTAGTVQLQWAQNTSTGGTPLVRKADSWMRYTRIG